MIDFKKLSPEERAICNAHFLMSKEQLEQLILEHRAGIQAEKKQKQYEKQQEVRKNVTELNDESLKDISVNTIPTNDIAGASVKIIQDVEKVVNANIQRISSDPVKLEALSASLGCKRLFTKAYKEGATEEDMGAFVTELHNRIYPEGLKSVIKQATQYATVGTVIDGKDIVHIKKALNGYICMILQQSTKGNITAYICTNSYTQIENLYGSEYYAAALAYETKHIIDNFNKDATERPEFTPKPNLHKVLSGSLRIKQVTKTSYDLSSTSYSWNEDRTIACIVLDNPSTLGNQLQTSLSNIDKIPSHELNFDMNIFNTIASKPTLDTVTSIVSNATNGNADAISKAEDKVVFWEGIKRRGYLSNLG